MAACYAALEPGPALWNRYIAEIDKLRSLGTMSADDHQLLRHSQPARSVLMNPTGGSVPAFSATTVDDILERMRADMRAQLAVEADELLIAAKAKLEAERDELLRAERVKLDEAHGHHLLARSQLETATAGAEAARLTAAATAASFHVQQEASRRGIKSLAGTAALWSRRAMTVLLSLCVLVTLVLGATEPDSTQMKFAWVLGPLAALGMLVAYLDNVHELSVNKLGANLENWIKGRVIAYLTGKTDVPSDTNLEGPTRL
jgi:hypothetical protein